MHLPGGNNTSAVITGPQEPEFSEFMWMAEEDLESFDNQVILEVEQNLQNQMLQQVSIPRVNRAGEEEKFLQQMLEEEEARDTVFFDENASRNNEGVDEIQERLRMLNTNGNSNSNSGAGLQYNSSRFKFNPLAADFIPRDEISTSSNEENSEETKATADRADAAVENNS